METNLLPKVPKKKKGKGCLTVFIILFVLVGVVSVFTEDTKLETIALSSDEGNVYDINTDVPVNIETTPSDANLNGIECKTSGGELKPDGDNLLFAAEESGSYDMYVLCGGIRSNTITINIEDKSALAEKEALQKTEAEAAAQKAEEERIAAEAAAQKAEKERIAAEAATKETPQASESPQEQMVWIPQNGGRYHSKSSCSGMNNPQQVTLSEAEGMGFTPCQKCH